MSQPHGNSNEWRISSAADWDGTDDGATTAYKAAPGTGLALYVTDVTVIQGATARKFSILDGSAGTEKFASILAANAAQTYTFKTPIKLTSNTGLYRKSAGGSVGAGFYVGGFTARG